MGTIIVACMAGFSFGYCIMDMIDNRRSRIKLDEFLQEVNSHNYDD